MKGILFSIGLTMMGLIVLGAALSLAQGRTRENIDILKLSVYDRIYDESASIDNGYRSLVSNAITVTSSGNNVSFKEVLPNPYAADFQLDSARFVLFVRQFKDFEMKISVDEGNLPMFVLPAGILYNHTNGFGGNTISVSNAQAVKKYDITITLPASGSFNWTSINTDPGGLEVHIRGEPGGYDGTSFLSTSATSVFRASSGGNDTLLTFGPGKALDIASNSLTAEITTSMTIDTTAPLSVVLNDESINITASEYNITRIGPVRVL